MNISAFVSVSSASNSPNRWPMLHTQSSPRTKSIASRKTTRSKATNNPLWFSGIDRRSAEGRLIRDTILAIASEFGGLDALSETNKIMCRQAAMLIIAAQKLQTRMLAGEDVDDTQVVRMQNAACRTLAGMRARKLAKPATERQAQ